MKSSHYSAPRTLAECSFVTGYSSANYRTEAQRVERVAHIAMYALALLFAGLWIAGYLAA